MGLRTYTRAGAAIYRSPRWKAVRLQAKRRDGWKCVKCSAAGKLEVDHIQPIRTRPDLAYELDTLQSLCPSCHTKKTRIEVGLDPLDPERQRWRDLVRNTHRNPQAKIGDIPCLNL